MKLTQAIALAYIHDVTRRGAMFSINGGDSWMNHGGLAEALAKHSHGLDPRVDGNTAFDEGSDVPEFHASVKSHKATLTTKPLAGSTFEEKLADYFRRVASTEFWWVEFGAGTVTIYKMDAAKFAEFAKRFAFLTCYGVIRFRGSSSKMLAWLEANC